MKILKNFARDMPKFLIFLLSISFWETALGSFELAETSHPVSVQNGSRFGVVLDCPYELEAQDRPDMGVKWFFNDKPAPFYQWIPDGKPQGLGALKSRLDLSFQVSNETAKKYRAVSFREPTTELSGKYSCRVWNFRDEKRMDMLLTVYTPATDFYVTSAQLEPDSVTVSCTGEGLYPEPTLKLFRMIKATGTYQFESEALETDLTENGTFSVSLEKTFHHADLEPPTTFLCSITIPSTEYQIDRDIVYYPGGTSSHTRPNEGNLLILLLISFFSTVAIWHS